MHLEKMLSVAIDYFKNVIYYCFYLFLSVVNQSLKAVHQCAQGKRNTRKKYEKGNIYIAFYMNK